MTDKYIIKMGDSMKLNNKKFILVLSQRDIKHPYKGGAEVYLHNALKQISKKIPIVHLSAYHPKQNVKEESIDNIYYIRRGKSLLSLTWEAIIFYFKNRDNIVAIIDHSNTHQFFTFIWARKKRVFFIHQLTLNIWPYFFGKILGFFLRIAEEILIFLSRGTTITVSNSTKKDLLERHFKDVYICPEGNYIRYESLPDNEKEDYFIYVGRLVPYKRVEDAILMAHHLKKKLYIVGRGKDKYVNKLKKLIKELGSDCEITGFLSVEEKEKLIKKAKLLIMPSIREGWGLVITESANLGTPSLVYPVHGVIEAVNYGKAGFLAKDTSWHSLVDAYNKITDKDYEKIRVAAFEYSKKFTWDKTAKEFEKIIKKILEKEGFKL